MDSSIPSTFASLFLSFVPLFTAPGFENFVTLVTGWITCTGRHTITRVIQHGSGRGRRKHHSALYRLLSRTVWVTDALGQVLCDLILPLIPGSDLFVLVDDTLMHKSGPHLWGAGMHHDPLASTYGRGTSAGRKVSFAFGHNWVILSLWVPLPWNSQRGMALPILFRLYRSKKRCPPDAYRKRTLLATEMVEVVRGWVSGTRKITVVGDAEYACKTVVRSLPPGVEFIGPMPMNAAFYAVPARKSGKGRPCQKGHRLPSPMQLAEDESTPWRRETLPIYGRQVKALVKTQVGLWYTVAGTRRGRMMVTRDPKGRINDRAYFSTDADITVEHLAQGMSRRWAEEVFHHNVKQFMGAENPQNGWWRRRHGHRAKKKLPGPQAHRSRGERAVRQTVPLAFVAYVMVVVFYLRFGTAEADVRQARDRAPWYRHKSEPSFVDMLAAARRTLWAGRFSQHPEFKRVAGKIQDLLPEWLLAS